MANTINFSLPLLSPSQAQKHVTVNEALVRLDAVAQLRILASDIDTPPSIAQDGASYIVPETAVLAWAGRGGQVAVWSNGGWVYLEPSAGWRAWSVAEAAPLLFDGQKWIAGVFAGSPGGAMSIGDVVEFDQVVQSGTRFETTVAIPAGVLVLGITGRVLTEIAGTLSGWRIGVAGAEDRYGTGLGKQRNSYLLGLSSSPQAYYSAMPLIVGAESGFFAGGLIRFALHLMRLEPPRAL